MKFAFRSKLSLFPLLVVAVSVCGSANQVGAAESPELKAAASEIDITPPAGHRMAGYFDERLATGTHDPLKAKAIVLRQGSEEIALVFCDLVGVFLNVPRQARSEASAKTAIPAKNIVIA